MKRFPLVLMGLWAAAGHAAPPMDAAIQLRVMAFNIWYGGEQVSFPAVVEAIRRADADVVGIEEPDGNLSKLAAAAGYPYYDMRRNILSRFPIFDSGAGMRVQPGAGAYSIVGLDPDALHAWVMVRPGEVVAVDNTHLSSDPYGPEAVRDGGDLETVLALEHGTRLPEAQALLPLARLAQSGVPVFLTGDFNSPAPRDWSAAMQSARPAVVRYPVAWPAVGLLLEAGLRDSYRDVYPDPAARPGFTWTAGMPHPFVRPRETMDRIDFVFAGGPSRTLASQIVGEPGGPDVDIGVSPWPSDHRAVVSTFRVTPIQAPPLIAVTPTRVSQGDVFLVRGHDPASEQWSARVVAAGAPAATARLAVLDEIGPWRRVARFSSAELEPGEYDAVLIGRDGRELKRARFAIVAPGVRASLAALTPDVQPGGAVRVSWANAPGSRFDWIGVFRAGDPGIGNHLVSAYTGARFSGETDIPLTAADGPLAPGDYELRLLLDDSETILARAGFAISSP